MMYSGIIYKYTSPSGKSYIGQTARPRSRKIEHKCHSQKCTTVFQKAVKKYGWENFKYEVLETITCASKEELSIELGNLERQMIQTFGTVIPGGYNIAIGGSGPLGFNHSEETRKRMSESHKGHKHTPEELEKMSKALMGHILSEETKAKISKARSIPIIQLSMDGQYIKEWPSAKVAAEELGLIRSNITACCKNRPKKLSAGGYKWKYKK